MKYLKACSSLRNGVTTASKFSVNKTEFYFANVFIIIMLHFNWINSYMRCHDF